MHFKNENDNKSNISSHHHAPTTSTASTTSSNSSSSSSSGDSGVIIVDNRTPFNQKKSNNHSSENQKNIIKNNNNNNNHSNIKSNNSNFNHLSGNCTTTKTTDKIENLPLPQLDSSTWNEKLNAHTDLNNIKCNDHNYNIPIPNNIRNVNSNTNSNCNSNPNNNNNNKNNNIADNDVSVRNINIENVINISKVDANFDNDNEHKNNDKNDLPTMNSESHQKSNNHHHHHQHCCTMKSNNTKINCSPTVSIRSTSISISSIDGNAIDSSIVDSDSDGEADAEGIHTNYVVKKLGQQTTYAPGTHDIPDINKGMTVISQKISPSNAAASDLLQDGFNPSILNNKLSGGPLTTPQIGSIALTNSTDVTFGDKHFYEGPVTIQQILIDRRDKNKNDETTGHDNPTFVNDPGCDTSRTKSSLSISSTTSPFQFICQRKLIFITAIIVVLALSIGIYILSTSLLKSKILIGDGDDSRMNIPINSTIDKDNIGSGFVLRVVARDGWLAQPPSKPLAPLSLPVKGVVIIATQTDICLTQAACTYRVRYIQTFNIESTQNDDIIYNFLIGGDGNVYEGRGWNSQGAHIKGYNNETISFGYIGTFRLQSPNDKQMSLTKLLLAEGVRLGKLAPDYKIYAANKLNPTSLETASSTSLYESFKGWPHWSD